jgi:hypothetical protein
MLVTGSILVGGGALVASLLALFFRHPRAPRWTRPEAVAMLAALPVTGALGLGLGYLLAGGYRLLQGVGNAYELGAPLAAALVVAGSWSLLGIGRRLEAYGALGADAGSSADPAAPPTPMSEGSPGAPSPKRPPQRPVRKAA